MNPYFFIVFLHKSKANASFITIAPIVGSCCTLKLYGAGKDKNKIKGLVTLYNGAFLHPLITHINT